MTGEQGQIYMVTQATPSQHKRLRSASPVALTTFFLRGGLQFLVKVRQVWLATIYWFICGS